MNEKLLYKTGMVFGVFDGFHQGHRFFLERASKQCATLIVVVALDAVVARMKHHAPRHTFDVRAKEIRTHNPKLIVVPSDATLGAWGVIKQHAPDIIFLGYDQIALKNALDDIHMPYALIDAHYPEKFKSSILHKTDLM